MLGEAEKTVVDLNDHLFAVKPTDFQDCFPKLLVQEGDKVKAGSPLFMDKYRSEIFFTSPVSGKVKEIRRGAKRKILDVIVESDGKNESEDFGAADISKAGREEIVEKLLKSGVWPVIRQRPYSTIADSKDTPKSIFIAAFESGPLAPDYDLLLHNHGTDFQAGLDILKKLTSGKIYLNVHAKKTFSKVFLNAKNVEINSFQGPHPVGNISVHISRLDPINKGDIVWYVNPQDLLIIGRLFLTGKYDASKMVALTGSEVKRPKYYKTYKGASIEGMLANNTTDVEIRHISGNVLTGTTLEKDGFVGYYDNQVTLIPEGNYSEFLGWITPGFGKFSISNTFPKFLYPNKKYRLDTNLHGGKRAYVMTSVYGKVFPFDIFPIQLIKAIMVEDIDAMENLGIYEIDEEDFALCEVVDVSKTEIQQIVRKGLDLIRKEMS
jgi:Na+-transporting NADH:ubiquinone oxidoreductase subunit A